MPGGMLHHPLAARPSRSLAARGDLAHTFGSLAGFVVVSFLCWGIYILEDAFADPLNAGAAAVISAAFIITLAFILLFYLIKPGKRPRWRADRSSRDSAAAAEVPFFAPPVGATRHDNLRNDLPYQRFYVD